MKPPPLPELSVGNPFLFREIACALENKTYTPPTVDERLETALYQLRLAVEDKGEAVAVQESRKQICEYLSGIRGASAMRCAVNRQSGYQEIEKLARDFLADLKRKEGL